MLNSEYRGLGFIELNERTEINNSSHHIDEEFVIWIPLKLHKRFWHSVKTGHRIEEMNDLAFEYLGKEQYLKYGV
jgi:hypothetical protein